MAPRRRDFDCVLKTRGYARNPKWYLIQEDILLEVLLAMALHCTYYADVLCRYKDETVVFPMPITSSGVSLTVERIGLGYWTTFKGGDNMP